MAGLSSRAKSTILYGFAVHLSVGFLVAFIISMVHVEKAQADARAKLVKAYDESVDAWLAGDGETYARKWTGEEALPLPSVSVEREDPERPQSSVEFGVLQSGPEATGSLRDDEPDYKRYDEGTMLVAPSSFSASMCFFQMLFGFFGCSHHANHLPLVKPSVPLAAQAMSGRPSPFASPKPM